MTRQYIGARYVPKFFENPEGGTGWKQGVPYEPLTIVTYMGNSYTSKREVPANVGYPNDNPYYWVLTANYNAQINSLSEQVTELAGDVNDLAENVQDMQDIINASGIERRYVFVMDSFGGHVLEPLIEAMGIPSTHYWSVWNGGSGFNTTGSQYPNFKTMLQGLTVPNPQKITDVVVIGGINDGGSVFTPDDARAGFDAFYDYAKGRFVNARIWWGRNGMDTSLGSTGNMHRAQELRAYTGLETSTKPYVKMEGIDYCLYDNNNKNADCIHPNTNGAKIFASAIASHLMGGNNNYMTSEVYQTPITPAGNLSIVGGLQIYRNNDKIVGNIRTLTINNVNQHIGDGATIKLGTVENKIIRGGFYNSTGVSYLELCTSYMQAVDTENRVRKITGTLLLDVDNNLWLEVRSPQYLKQDSQSHEWSFVTSNVTQLMMQYANFVIDGLQN